MYSTSGVSTSANARNKIMACTTREHGMHHARSWVAPAAWMGCTSRMDGLHHERAWVAPRAIMGRTTPLWGMRDGLHYVPASERSLQTMRGVVTAGFCKELRCRIRRGRSGRCSRPRRVILRLCFVGMVIGCPRKFLGTPLLNCRDITCIVPPHPHAHLYVVPPSRSRFRRSCCVVRGRRGPCGRCGLRFLRRGSRP